LNGTNTDSIVSYVRQVLWCQVCLFRVRFCVCVWLWASLPDLKKNEIEMLE